MELSFAKPSNSYGFRSSEQNSPPIRHIVLSSLTLILYASRWLHIKSSKGFAIEICPLKLFSSDSAQVFGWFAPRQLVLKVVLDSLVHYVIVVFSDHPDGQPLSNPAHVSLSDAKTDLAPLTQKNHLPGFQKFSRHLKRGLERRNEYVVHAFGALLHGEELYLLRTQVAEYHMHGINQLAKHKRPFLLFFIRFVHLKVTDQTYVGVEAVSQHQQLSLYSE